MVNRIGKRALTIAVADFDKCQPRPDVKKLRPSQNEGFALHNNRYSNVQIALHWMVVALIIAQWLTSDSIARTHNPLIPPSSTDLLLHSLHNYGGMAIGVLVALRIALRLMRPVKPPAGLAAWQKQAAFLVQWGLYASLLAQAATGFAASYLTGKAAPVHAFLWNVTLTLAFAHIVAALIHIVRRDGIAERMTPRFGNRPAATPGNRKP